jgi:hypothetical protein
MSKLAVIDNSATGMARRWLIGSPPGPKRSELKRGCATSPKLAIRSPSRKPRHGWPTMKRPARAAVVGGVTEFPNCPRFVDPRIGGGSRALGRGPGMLICNHLGRHVIRVAGARINNRGRKCRRREGVAGPRSVVTG